MQANVEQLREDLIKWNVRFPLDREYRKKHNIAFGSEAHLELNQVIVYLEFLEERLYADMMNQAKETIAMEEAYKKGKWLKDDPDVDELDGLDLFDKLNVSNIPNSNIQIEE